MYQLISSQISQSSRAVNASSIAAVRAVAMRIWPPACIIGLLLAVGTGLILPPSLCYARDADRFQYHWQNEVRHTGAKDTLTSRISSQEEYQRLLSTLDSLSGPAAYFDQSVVKRHLGAIIPVLPDTLLKSLQVPNAVEEEDWTLLPGSTGAELSAWWRSRDPFPATDRNRRLTEHLRRTDYAYRHFAREDDEDALDDRGAIYLRFGAPEWREEIRVGYGGEFWVYPSLHDAAEYLLVRDRGKGYIIGQPTDLLPDHELRGFGPTERGTRKAIRALSMLKSIYADLSHYRSRYGPRYSDVSMYLEEVRQASQGLAAELHHRPHTFVYQAVENIKTDEAYAQRRREQAVPLTHTTVGEDLAPLPLAARPIRTLSETGSTQVNVYWATYESATQLSESIGESMQGQILRPPNLLLTATAVQEKQNYEALDRYTTHTLVRPSTQEANHEGASHTTSVQHAAFILDTAAIRGALQVDMYLATIDEESQSLRRQAKIRSGVQRFEDLAPLNDDPDVLEISDIAPVDVSGTVPIEEAPVIPYASMHANEPLALKFEIYHLTFDENERTTYTVEYSVERRTERGWLPMLSRGNEATRTSVESTYEGYKKDVTEYVVIDLDEWRENNRQDLRVEVRVRDENSAQQVERHVAFTLAP